MIRSTIRTTIRQLLGEATPVFWTNALLDQWCEDAQKDIVWKAKLKRTRGTFNTTPATSRYTISSVLPNCLRIMHDGIWIYDNTQAKWFKLKYRTKEYMDQMYPDWPNSDEHTYTAWVTSTVYAVGDLVYIPSTSSAAAIAYECLTAHTSGTFATDLAAAKWEVSTWNNSSVPQIYMEDTDEDILELYPIPQASCIGTGYARVYYSSIPTVMASDNSQPDLDTHHILDHAVVDYVCAMGFASRGYGDLSNDYWSKYYDKIKSYMIEKNNKDDEDLVMRNYRNY